MGGTINIMIRRENGEFFNTISHTGDEDILCHTENFNMGLFDKAINHFIKVKEEHCGDDSFIIKTIAPISYGLLFFDFKTKTIHSMQSYSQPAYIYPLIFMNLYHNPRIADIEKLIKLNLFDIELHNENIGSIHEVIGRDVDTQKISKLLQDSFKPGNMSKVQFYLLVPKIFRKFKIIYYETDKEKFQQNLIKSGISISTKDTKIWDEYRN